MRLDSRLKLEQCHGVVITHTRSYDTVSDDCWLKAAQPPTITNHRQNVVLQSPAHSNGTIVILLLHQRSSYRLTDSSTVYFMTLNKQNSRMDQNAVLSYKMVIYL